LRRSPVDPGFEDSDRRPSLAPIFRGALRRAPLIAVLVLVGALAASSGWADPQEILGAAGEAGARSAVGLLTLFAVLLVISGFVSGTETAIFSLDRIEVLHTKAAPGTLRRPLAYLLERPNDTLTTILILNNVVNVAISLVGGALAELYFRTMSPQALAVVAFAVTAAILVFGEVVPKCVAQVGAHGIAPWVAWPTLMFALALKPARRVMNVLIGWVFRGLNIPVAREADLVSEEELKVLLGAGRVSTLLEDEEREMILGVFELDDTYAEQIMTPRSEVLAFPDTLTQEEMIAKLKTASHSRVPIYHGDLDHPVGFILAKEVLLDPSGDWRECLREIPLIPERMRLDDLLGRFRKSSTKIAAVVDEYGQVAGVVTIRDVLEEIVGDMAERHEKVVADVRTLDDGRLQVHGRTRLADLARALSLDLPPDRGATAGGFVMNTLGHVPHEGDELLYGGYAFRVKRMLGRKVMLLEIAPADAEPAAPAPPETSEP
jgi:putative hemolysin